MSLLQIYVVFHKRIYEECYREIRDEDLERYFTFVAVNPTIEKEYPTSKKFKILKEWELEKYEARMQSDGFNENSAIYHIWANGLHKQYKYIGFSQYDMVFTADALNNILIKVAYNIDNKPLYFANFVKDYNFCAKTVKWDGDDAPVKDFVIKDYQEYFGRPFTGNSTYPLTNSYIIPKTVYEKIMPWVSQLRYKMYPWSYSHPFQNGFGQIASTFERVMAFVIGEEFMECNYLPIIHDHNYKQNCY